jgi:hypothetical protein
MAILLARGYRTCRALVSLEGDGEALAAEKRRLDEPRCGAALG